MTDCGFTRVHEEDYWTGSQRPAASEDAKSLYQAKNQPGIFILSKN